MTKNIIFNSITAFALILFVNFTFSSDVKAAVSHLGEPASTNNTDLLSVTVPAGSNRVLVIVVSDADATSVAGVSFGGSPLTSRVQHTDGVAVDSMWTLSLGTSAVSTTQSITVLSTGGTANSVQFIGANAFSGVDQDNPLTNIQTADSFGSNVGSSMTVASKSGDIVFDIFDTFDYNPGGVRTPGSGQTIQNSQNNVFIGAAPFWSDVKKSPANFGGGPFGFYNTSTSDGAPSVNLSWTSDDTAMIHIAANVNSLAPTASSVAVSGKAVTGNGNGIKNATVYLTDRHGVTRKTVTGNFGSYIFNDIQVGSDYVLTIVGKRYTFTNPNRVVSIQSEIRNEDFVSEEF